MFKRPLWLSQSLSTSSFSLSSSAVTLGVHPERSRAARNTLR